jgi:hypothetical protein
MFASDSFLDSFMTTIPRPFRLEINPDTCVETIASKPRSIANFSIGEASGHAGSAIPNNLEEGFEYIIVAHLVKFCQVKSKWHAKSGKIAPRLSLRPGNPNPGGELKKLTLF